MKINLSVVDVNKAPVKFTVDFIANQLTTEVSGKLDAPSGTTVLTLPDDVWAIAMTIVASEHNDDLLRIRKTPGASEWKVDNPACIFTNSGNDLTCALMVGRLRSAPVIHIPDDQIAKSAGNPPGVLLFKSNVGFSYHSLFADPYDPFVRLDHPVLDPKVREDAREWDRLRVKRLKVDPKQSGVFYHLEYGDKRDGPRLFFSLYLPSPGPRSKMDYIVFYSPTTAMQGRFPYDKHPFRDGYPYGLTNKTVQEYPRHSQNYMFNGVHLVHQLLAGGSKAALLMPLAPFGDWSAFQTANGLHRLLLECSLFLHREFLTTAQAAMRPIMPEYAWAGGSVRLLTGLGIGHATAASLFGRYGDVPAIGSLAVSGYSSGSIPLQYLLTNSGDKLPDGFSSERFGTQLTNFDSLFREVWDIDCAHGPYHGYEAFEKALSKWYAKGSRRFRIYHSTYTGGDHDSIASESLKSLIKPNDIVNEVSVSEKGTKYWAKERHAAKGDWSSVRFADGFISSTNTTNERPYWMNGDAHHFLPKIAFGHAALLFNQGQ